MDNSKYPERKDFEWAVQLNRACLNIVGLWPNPEETASERVISNIRTLFSFFIVISILVPCLHSLIKIHSDLMLTVDNLQYTLPFFTTILKIPLFWWKKKDLTLVVNMIVDDWINSKNKNERYILIKWALRARIILTCTFLIITIGFLAIFGMPILGVSLRLSSNVTDFDRMLAVPTYYIYDVTKRPQYELTYISQCISVFTIALVYSGIDNFLGLLVFHICGQLDIMSNRLRNSHLNFHVILRNTVMHHIRLLRAIDTIEDTYNVMLLILFLYFGTVFAFCGFLTVSLFDNERSDIPFIRVIYLSIIITSLTIHTGLYCVVGETLISKSNGIHYAVYECEWFSLDSREAKDILPFMIKVNEPVYFTAGKIFPVTMVMFCSKDFEWAVQLNRACLNFVGLWPSREEADREKVISNIRALFSFVIVTSLLIPSTHSLIKIHSDLMLTLDNLQFTLPLLSIVIKLAIFWWKKKELSLIMNMIVKDWLSSKTSHERHTMIKWALRARIFITCTCLIILAGGLVIFGVPIFGKSLRVISNISHSDRMLAVQTYYIYDVTKRPQYELTFIGQFISFFIGCMIYTGIDNFLGFLVFHICGQLDIISYRLKNSNENFRVILRNSVMHHIRLLRAMETIEDTYNVMLLTVFLYTVILFAFTGFLLVSLFDDKEGDISLPRLFFLFIVIATILMHTGLYCAVGEILIATCNGVHYAVYDFEWFSLNPKEARDLIPCIIKFGEPVCFTAGKVFPVTLLLFSNIVKTSASYISVLLAARKT